MGFPQQNCRFQKPPGGTGHLPKGITSLGEGGRLYSEKEVLYVNEPEGWINHITRLGRAGHLPNMFHCYHVSLRGKGEHRVSLLFRPEENTQQQRQHQQEGYKEWVCWKFHLHEVGREKPGQSSRLVKNRLGAYCFAL